MGALFYLGVGLLLVVISARLFRLSNEPGRQLYQRLLRFSPGMREKMFANYPAPRIVYEEKTVNPTQQAGAVKPPDA